MLYGINVNPRYPDSHADPKNKEVLKNLAYVRMVFSAAASRQSIQQSFAFYDPIVKQYNDLGVSVLFVLNQETEWGNAAWDNGQWIAYANIFAQSAALIASHYKNSKVSYEIWNEQDIHGASSIYIDAKYYANLLRMSYIAIKRESPSSLVLIGGLASGAPASVTYIKAVEAAYGGKLLTDGVAIHPYGAYPTTIPDIPTGWFAPLKWALDTYNQGISYPLWITEIGVSEDTGFPQNKWGNIATYLKQTFDIVLKYPKIKANIWFAWSDVMRGAGIVDGNNNPKEPIYSVYMGYINSASTAPSPVPTPLPIPNPSVAIPNPFNVVVPTIIALRLRSSPDGEIIGSLTPSDYLLVDKNETLVPTEVGNNWIRVYSIRYKTYGYCSENYLRFVGFSVKSTTPVLNVRQSSNTTSPVVGQVKQSDYIYCLGGDMSFVGQNGKWLNVLTSNLSIGWVAAWYLALP